MSDDSRASSLEAPTAAAPAAAPLTLLNRDRAILQFNRRVLAQARRADVPLLERLRYVTIVSSNLDEFFEVRVADIIEATRKPGSGVTRGDLAAVAEAAHELIDEQYALFNEEVMPALQREGIVVLNHADRNEAPAVSSQIDQRGVLGPLIRHEDVATARALSHDCPRRERARTDENYQRRAERRDCNGPKPERGCGHGADVPTQVVQGLARCCEDKDRFAHGARARAPD